MAVQVTRSGGIYISINGDYSQFEQDLRAVRDLSKTAGTDISKALEGAIDPRRASASISSLTQGIMKAEAAARSMKANFSSQEAAIREWGQAVGIADKSLDHFVQMQLKAFKVQSAKAFTSELRNLQRLTGESDAAMNNLARSLGGTGREFDKAERAARGFCLNLRSLIVPAAQAALALASYQGASGFVSSGIDYNRQLQDAQNGIGTIVALNNNIVDSQGRMLTGQDKFNAAQKLSVDIVKTLDGATAIAAANFSDLLRAFQGSLGVAQARGLTWKDDIDMLIMMSNAMQAMGIDMQRLDTEMRAFLTGKNLDNSQVRQNLGLDEKAIKSWGTGKKFLDNFTKALEQANYAGAAAQGTYSVATAAAKENMQSLAAEMTKPLFDSLTVSADQFANALFEIDKTTGTWKVKENIQPLVDIGRDIAEAMGDSAASGVRAVTSGLEGLGGYINKEGDNIIAFFSTLGKLAEQAGKNATLMHAGVDDLDYLDSKPLISIPAFGVKSSPESSWVTARTAIETLLPEPDPKPLLDIISGVGEGLKQLSANAESAAQKTAESVTLINTSTGSIGKSGKGGASSIKSAESAIDSMRAKVQQLQAQLEQNKGQGFLVGLDKELAGLEKRMTKAPEATRQEFQRLKEEAQAIGRQIVSEQNLDTQSEFWRDYAAMTGLNLDRSVQAHERALAKQVELYRNAGVEIAAIEEWVAQKRLEFATDFESGATRALRDYAREASDAAANAERFVSNSFSSMEDALVDFVTTGKFEFRDLVDSIIADLARVAIRQTITAPLASGLSGVLGAVFGGSSSSSSFLGKAVGTGFGAISSLYNAKGNAFSAGSGLSSHRNTIVSRPTIFAFAKGGAPNVGIMGEAPGSPGEAVMPLTRASNGDLGVKARIEGGGSTSPNIAIESHVTVNANGGSPEQNEDLSRQVSVAVERSMRATVRDELLNQFRRGGMLSSSGTGLF